MPPSSAVLRAEADPSLSPSRNPDLTLTLTLNLTRTLTLTLIAALTLALKLTVTSPAIDVAESLSYDEEWTHQPILEPVPHTLSEGFPNPKSNPKLGLYLLKVTITFTRVRSPDRSRVKKQNLTITFTLTRLRKNT